MDNNDIKEKLVEFSLNLKMYNIEAGPPLSTILGNFGINTVKFCKELKEEIDNKIPNYFILKLNIIIYYDKTYKFFFNEPTIAFLLKLLAKKKEKKLGSEKKFIKIITIKDLFFVMFFKYGEFNENILKSIYGTVVSLKYYINLNENN